MARKKVVINNSELGQASVVAESKDHEETSTQTPADAFKEALQKSLRLADAVNEERLVNEVLGEVTKSDAFSEFTGTEGVNSENAAMLGQLIGELISSDRTGKEPDWDSFKPKSAAMVEDAVNTYLKTESNEGSDNLGKRILEIKKLFHPPPTVALPQNRKMRLLTKVGRCTFAEDYLSSARIFYEFRNSDRSFDQHKITKKIRRVDGELRNLDTMDREEFSYNFVENILSAQNEKHALYLRYSLDRLDFEMLSEDARKIIHDVVMMYLLAVEHHNAYMEGSKYVANLNEEKLKELVEFARSPFKEFPHEESSDNEHEFGKRLPIRYVQKDEYLKILGFSKAMYLALPDGFQDTVTAAFWVAPDSIRINLDSGIVSYAIGDASKNMRKEFINIAQGRSSIENFFNAVYAYYAALNVELNNRVRIASDIVGLYDSLGLPIADALEVSRRRIALELPF